MAVRKSDVVSTLTKAADVVASQKGKTDIIEALCPKYTPTQIAAVGAFGDFIQNEYGEKSLGVWGHAQRDRRKIERALRRAARKISDGSITL